MPDTAEILSGLKAISNEAWLVAVAWHVVLGVFLGSLLLGWRPSRRMAGTLAAAPLLSVSGFAWAYSNPFNGTVFLLVAVAVTLQAARLPSSPLGIARLWQRWLGVLMVAFGWVYPHFLRTDSLVAYLYSAPMGLVPCPTLSVLVGLALLAGGLRSRGWSATLAIAGLFYGAVGTFRLHVMIDVVLLLGSAALAVAAWTGGREAPRAGERVSAGQ